MAINLTGAQLGSVNLEELHDVGVVTPVSGHYLRYNATPGEWQNATINADVYNFLTTSLRSTNSNLELTFSPGTQTIDLTVMGAGSSASPIIPLNEIVFGTGAGIDSSSTLTFEEESGSLYVNSISPGNHTSEIIVAPKQNSDTLSIPANLTLFTTSLNAGTATLAAGSGENPGNTTILGGNSNNVLNPAGAVLLYAGTVPSLEGGYTEKNTGGFIELYGAANSSETSNGNVIISAGSANPTLNNKEGGLVRITSGAGQGSGNIYIKTADAVPAEDTLKTYILETFTQGNGLLTGLVPATAPATFTYASGSLESTGLGYTVLSVDAENVTSGGSWDIPTSVTATMSIVASSSVTDGTGFTKLRALSATGEYIDLVFSPGSTDGEMQVWFCDGVAAPVKVWSINYPGILVNDSYVISLRKSTNDYFVLINGETYPGTTFYNEDGNFDITSVFVETQLAMLSSYRICAPYRVGDTVPGAETGSIIIDTGVGHGNPGTIRLSTGGIPSLVIDNNAWSLSSSVGTAGQTIVSNGPGLVPSWASIPTPPSAPGPFIADLHLSSKMDGSFASFDTLNTLLQTSSIASWNTNRIILTSVGWYEVSVAVSAHNTAWPDTSTTYGTFISGYSYPERTCYFRGAGLFSEFNSTFRNTTAWTDTFLINNEYPATAIDIGAYVMNNTTQEQYEFIYQFYTTVSETTLLSWTKPFGYFRVYNDPVSNSDLGTAILVSIDPSTETTVGDFMTSVTSQLSGYTCSIDYSRNQLVISRATPFAVVDGDGTVSPTVGYNYGVFDSTGQFRADTDSASSVVSPFSEILLASHIPVEFDAIIKIKYIG